MRFTLARRLGAGICVFIAAALLATATGGAGRLARLGMPSGEFWALAGEHEIPKLAPAVSGVYQPKTDEVFLDHMRKARGLPQHGGAWRNVGPVGGLEYIPGVGNGNELRGNAGGIGTAIAVDPSDPSGNTAYLGTLGGLYKTSDGGKTLVNLNDGKFDRQGVGAIAVDPKDPKTVYFGSGVAINTLSDDTVGTGVYVTHDGGKTFSRPAQNTNGYGVNAISVNPVSRTVLVGTNFGLWRSTDLGASFHKIAVPSNADHTGPAPTPLGSTISAIVRHPSSANEVTLAVGWARGKENVADSVIGTGNGLYRSTNDGQSFTFMDSTAGLTWPGASSDPVGRVALAYGSADGAQDHLWALVSDAGRAAGGNGAQDLLEDLPASPLGATTLNGLYQSTDNGESWTLRATAQTLATAIGGTTSAALYPIYAAGAQSTFNIFVETDPTNANRVWVGLEEVYQGDLHADQAMTWTAIAKYADACGFLTYLAYPGGNGTSCPSVPPYGGVRTTHPDQHSVAIARTPNGIRMYEGNDGGWWVQDAHSLDDGTTGFDTGSWRSLNAPPTVLPWDVTFLKDGSVALALQDNGTVRLRRDGTAYMSCGGDGVFVWPGKDGQSMYCGVPGLTMLATEDDWQTTINISPGDAPGTPGVPGASFLSPWAVDPDDTDHILAAAGAIYETHDGPRSNTMDPTQTVLLGTTWERVFTPPDLPPTLDLPDPLPDLTPSWDASAMHLKGGLAYVGFCYPCRPAFSIRTIGNPERIRPQLATNLGGEWHMVASTGLPHQQIGDIVVDPKDPKIVYVGLRSYLVMGADPAKVGTQKVMMSRDAGHSFTDITGNLPRADVHGIAIRDGQLIVAGDVGLFISPAGSGKWSRLGTGLPNVPFRSMKMDDSGRYVLAGAYGRGAWVYDFGSAAGAAKSVTKKPVVKGVKKTLPATGGEANLALAVGLLGLAGLLSRRLRGTARPR